ncbi:hypothetical protein SPFM20_00184 [Salmonella phage SPFM20]|nr:hypothetical protein SPFM20_00184 [Salmonella phage SPFM20]
MRASNEYMNNCPIRVRETGLKVMARKVYRSINGKCRHSFKIESCIDAVTIETLMRVADTLRLNYEIALLVGCSPSQISAIKNEREKVRLSYIITRVTAKDVTQKDIRSILMRFKHQTVVLAKKAFLQIYITLVRVVVKLSNRLLI